MEHLISHEAFSRQTTVNSLAKKINTYLSYLFCLKVREIQLKWLKNFQLMTWKTNGYVCAQIWLNRGTQSCQESNLNLLTQFLFVCVSLTVDFESVLDLQKIWKNITKSSHIFFIQFPLKCSQFKGTWVAQLVKYPIQFQLRSWSWGFMGLSLTSCSVLTVWSLLRIFSLTLSLCPSSTCTVSVSLKINK